GISGFQLYGGSVAVSGTARGLPLVQIEQRRTVDPTRSRRALIAAPATSYGRPGTASVTASTMSTQAVEAAAVPGASTRTTRTATRRLSVPPPRRSPLTGGTSS